MQYSDIFVNYCFAKKAVRLDRVPHWYPTLPQQTPSRKLVNLIFSCIDKLRKRKFISYKPTHSMRTVFAEQPLAFSGSANNI